MIVDRLAGPDTKLLTMRWMRLSITIRFAANRHRAPADAHHEPALATVFRFNSWRKALGFCRASACTLEATQLNDSGARFR